MAIDKTAIKISLLSLTLLIVIIFFNERSRHKKINHLINNRGKTVAISTHCVKNIKSSLHTLYYKFDYKGELFYGTIDFSLAKRGDICNGVYFIVEFDSTNPNVSLLELDSMVRPQ